MFEKISPPDGEKIVVKDGELSVPSNPIIPYIVGDGIGPDITAAMRSILNAAVEKSYGGQRKIAWFRLFAGEDGFEKYGEYLPQETVDAIREYVVAIKGPLTTPVGGGFRSLNVAMRQRLDLYACVRPAKHLKGVPAPLKEPEKVDVVVFRENTEDVYAGIEWEEGTEEVEKVRNFLSEKMGKTIRPDSAIGIKPISITGSKRLVRAAIKYALKENCRSVTLMHKGNIMKFTEGAFREWGYEVAEDEFPDRTITEKEVNEKYDGKVPENKILINDRIADAMFQQILLRPDEYDVIATMNLNGDYISDACAAQVGGLGIAPGSNFNYETGAALFEATHGTAPKYRGLDKVNPCSLTLSGAFMLHYMGWQEAADLIEGAIEKTITQKRVTYDLERQIEGATLLKCSEFGQAVIENM